MYTEANTRSRQLDKQLEFIYLTFQGKGRGKGSLQWKEEISFSRKATLILGELIGDKKFMTMFVYTGASVF